jgi:hypothetical protein
VTLAVAVEGGAPPTEFRLFKAGVNETTKGDFLFDDAAAAAVMAAYRKHAVGLAIDLEHLSLDADRVNYDPDARGWADLEVRNGELWAVNVKWTPDGEQRLTEKRQRYVSPAFTTDNDGRINEVWNVAICAMPATHGAPALVAANGATMEADREKQLAAILKAVGLDPGTPAKIARDLGLDAGATLAEIKDAMAKFEGMVDKANALFEDTAPEGETPEGEAPANDAPAAAAPPAEAAAVAASRARDGAALLAPLAKLTGETSPSAIVATVEGWHRLAVEHQATAAKLAADRAALEATERDGLAVKLAKRIGPGAAWADPLDATDPSKRRLAQPFAAMPLDDLRGFVAKLHGAPASAAPRAPAQGSAAVELSAAEMAKCAARGIDPVKYASTRAAIAARSTRSTTGV